ncbi:MAG TPA: ABC transporter substrate-binding protein [Xanthobacteraceae bacterium]
MKHCRIAVAAFGLSAALGCAARAQAPVRLGLIDMYGGGFAAQADAIRLGFQIAVDEANAAGGANGRSFALTTADMGISVEKAITEARRMILDDKLAYVTVGSHSGAAVALADLVRNQNAFGLGAFATTKRFTGEEGHPMIGRANLSTVEIGRIMAAHLKSMPNVKRIAVISPDFEFGKHFTEDFVAAAKQARPDVTVVRQEWPKFGATDFTPHVTALQAEQIDMVVSSLFSGDLLNFLKAAKGFDLFGGSTKLFTSGLDLLRVSTFKDGLPEGALATVWYPFYALQGPENAAFIAEVKKRTSSYPTGSHLVGYVAGRMLTDAIRKSGNPDDPRATARAMSGLQFKSPVGEVKVRACDNMALYNFFVGKVKRDAALPDGIGVTDVQAYNTADYARSCEDIAQARKRS